MDADGSLLYTSRGTGAPTSTSHFASSASVTPEYRDMVVSTTYAKDYNLDFKDVEILRKAATSSAYFIYHSVLDDGNTIYVYGAVADVENVADVTDTVYTVFSLCTITLLCVIFIILVSRLSKPVEEMNSVTKNMAALDFSKKCKDHGNDEVGELGKSINILSDKLDMTLADLKDKNLQLEKDIELRLALDNARKDFISNVSHELKTPIAIISGYAEGVCEGISDDPQVIKEYCGIIRDESNKMNSLVLQLLEITKLESTSKEFTPSLWSIGEAAVRLLDHLSLQIEAEGITVRNDIPVSALCWSQEDKIETVLRNYVTNAISHCSGEKKIILSSEKKDGLLRISVFNTGERIADEDISSIWDSFYRGDKAHDRSDNRFGLGLSIVKTVMAAHKCGYGVQNVDGGVVFWFEVAEDSHFYDDKKQ